MWNKLKLSLVLCMLTSSLAAQQVRQDYIDYISQYKDIAVSEMYRSGIPASITLAQGLLESGAGYSELAVKSNNHFGIKCHNGWQGGRVYHDDDAKGECFRKYDSPEDSYRDHSDFLRYRDRYKFLFEYGIKDYKSWAYGLRQAGYATDPNYPTKLISLIERYELDKYDASMPSHDPEKGKPDKGKPDKDKEDEIIPPPPSQIEQVHRVEAGTKETFRFSLTRELFMQNGVTFIYSVEGETYESIARSNNLFVKELLKFNDLKGKPTLKAGTVVYLQKKKKNAAKGLEMHVVEKGETLRQIAQRYGIQLKHLCKINGLDMADTIRENDILRLRK